MISGDIHKIYIIYGHTTPYTTATERFCTTATTTIILLLLPLLLLKFSPLVSNR